MTERKVTLPADRVGRIYIAGPMTGIEGHNYPAFNKVAEQFRAAGYHVENPADHGFVENATWGDYLRYDLASLSSCESIAFLPGWQKSQGAQLEAYVALKLGLTFMFTEGADDKLPEGAGALGSPMERAAIDEWLAKVAWLRPTLLPSELGKHFADVLSDRARRSAKMADALLFAVDSFKRMSSADGSGHKDLIEPLLRIAGCTEMDLHHIKLQQGR